MTKLSDYRKRCLEQTIAWAEGYSFHNREDNECCPDFSCCVPEMFQKDKQKRLDYLYELQERYQVIQ